MHVALRLAGILRAPEAQRRLRTVEVLQDPLVAETFADDPEALRLLRRGRAPRARSLPEKLYADAWSSEWERAINKGPWGVEEAKDKPAGEIKDLLDDLMRRALRGRLPRLEASMDSLTDGRFVWQVSLLDACWLQFLHTVAVGRLPTLCPCGVWHERQGLYHDDACRNRWKARRHYRRTPKGGRTRRS